MDAEKIKLVEKNKKTFRWQVQSIVPGTDKIKNHFLPFANLTNALDVATKISLQIDLYKAVSIFDRVSRKVLPID